VYLPRHFINEDEADLFAFMEQTTVATLTTHGSGGLIANQVPLLVDAERRLLWGHFARPNPQLADLATADTVLVNFLGPSGYVSPSWYTTSGMVPTWNFVSVQVRGVPVIHDNPAEVRKLVERLSARQESEFADPWTFDKVPVEQQEKLLSAIVGFCVEISDLMGKYKLSQNRSVEDRAGVIDGLRKQQDPLQHQLADMIEVVQ
jgi:transcriptional regulator